MTMVPADPRLLELAQYGIEVGVLDTPCEVLRFLNGRPGFWCCVTTTTRCDGRNSQHERRLG